MNRKQHQKPVPTQQIFSPRSMDMTAEDTKEINDLISNLTGDDKIDIGDDEIQDLLQSVDDSPRDKETSFSEEIEIVDSSTKNEEIKQEKEIEIEKDKKKEKSEKKKHPTTPKRERKSSLRKTALSRSVAKETSTKRSKLSRGMSEATIVPKYKTQLSRLTESQPKERSSSLPGVQEGKNKKIHFTFDY